MKLSKNQTLSEHKSWDHEISFKKKLYQKNYQYINYCQKNYKNYEIILTVIYEENIYDISLVKQNTQSFLYQKKMTNDDYI